MTPSSAAHHARSFVSISALALAGGILVLSGLDARPALAAPEPAPVPKRWQLDVESGPLRMAVVNVPDVGPRAYFYLTYKVINNEAQDLLFAPAFELASDGLGEPLRSGRDVPVAVTRAILEKLENQLMEDQITIVGTLLRGSENAKEGVVIWPVPEMRASEIAVYGAGFSGETATMEVPDSEGKMDKKVLRKTRMLRFRLPGELDPSGPAEFWPVEQRWIMR